MKFHFLGTVSQYRISSISSNPLSLLTFEESVHRDIVLSVTNNNWDPDLDSIVWDDTIEFSDAVSLYNWFGGGVAPLLNTTRNQRLRLLPGFDNNRSTSIFSRPSGRDYAINGKVLLIEGASSRVSLNFRWSSSGSRGIYIRNIRLAGTVSTSGLNNPNWVPGANTINIISAGSGYIVGETLTLPAANGVPIYINPIITVASIGIDGSITGVTLDAVTKGVMTATTTVTVLGSVGTGASLQFIPGSNPRDANYLMTIARNPTQFKFPVWVFEDVEFGGKYTSPFVWEWISGLSIASSESVIVRNCKFFGLHVGMKVASCRSLVRANNDFVNLVADGMTYTNTLSTTVYGGLDFTNTFGSTTTYAHSYLNTFRARMDEADLVNPLGQLMGLFLEHADYRQMGTGADTGDIFTVDEFDCAYGQGPKYVDAIGKRFGGGIQGLYNDDTSKAIKVLAFSCIMVAAALLTYAGHSGDGFWTYCTAARVGNITPGSSASDVNPGFVGKKKYGTLISSNHKVRKCSMGSIGVWGVSGVALASSNLIEDDNELIVLKDGVIEPYQSAFPTLGVYLDSDGNTAYNWVDDGIESPAEFRTRLYNTFGRSNGKGMLNPLTWPTV